ncbi:PREDICTED: phosphate transporter PHO1 homolog 9-like [Tarenaya hassleriana]|uniref:phosphate transporter PHO1 homolog 9-like n=1 Tax=Tarenaya hassleriana TaxID=28532 RepID=UPI00053C45E6|nr:PREDICTED: phosphate transporter PHO1 homolog 9-like [Tarenaya hassleriana]
MKFGRDFEVQMIQEWREAYVDYRALKLMLKQILRFRQQLPAFHQHHPPHPPPPAPPSSAPGAGNNHDEAGGGAAVSRGFTRRISLYRAFSGLTNRAKGSPRKRDKHNNHHHFHFFDEEEEQAILISQDETASYTTTFLSSAEEGGELEVMFFRRLDEEFNKVVRFYKQKIEEVMEEADELSRQLNVLIALRIKVENPIADLPEIIGFYSPPVSPEHHSSGVPAVSPMETIQEVEQENSVHGNRNKAFIPAPLEVLDRVKIKIEPETPLTTLKCMISSLKPDQTFSKSELKRAEELMSRAFVEFYQKLRFLKSYCFLNQMAFSKILKKYDKITSRNASKPYLHTVDNSYLGTSEEVSSLMSRVEATFIKHFAHGNHREGMRSLRPKAKREKHRITYILGFLSGCSVSLAIAIIVLVHIRDLTSSEGRHQYMENIFPLYSLFGLVALHLLMYAADVYFWSKCRVNYRFIFGFEQGTELGCREVLLIGSGLAVLMFLGVVSNLDMEMDPRTKSFSVITELVPLALLVILTVILFCPFNVIYRSSRYFFIRCIFHCLLSPLYKVVLPDFFLADQLTSQVQAFRSLLFYICYYGWGDFKRRSNKCYESDVYRKFYIIVAVIPYWFRFAQCIRRLVEEKNKNHGLNAMKYLSTIIAVASRTVFQWRKGTYWLTVAATTSSIATVFNTVWDLVHDWGLMNRNSKNPWLRDKLLVPYKSIYFIAMVVNVMLRLAWMQTVLGIREAPFLHRRALLTVVASLEILRRGIWNFFRLENEHLNNVGKYRAFKNVPLPFHRQELGGGTKNV